MSRARPRPLASETATLSRRWPCPPKLTRPNRRAVWRLATVTDRRSEDGSAAPSRTGAPVPAESADLQLIRHRGRADSARGRRRVRRLRPAAALRHHARRHRRLRRSIGLLGDVVGSASVALDLNQTHTISLFGVQGGGKSYTLGTIAEMASLPIPNINVLPQPLATVIFHYSPTMDYRPEFTSMVAPNTEPRRSTALKERYGAEPRALTDVLLLAPADKLDERQREYPGIEVRPLKFGGSRAADEPLAVPHGSGRQPGHVHPAAQSRHEVAARRPHAREAEREGSRGLVTARSPEGHGQDAPRARRASTSTTRFA